MNNNLTHLCPFIIGVGWYITYIKTADGDLENTLITSRQNYGIFQFMTLILI